VGFEKRFCTAAARISGLVGAGDGARRTYCRAIAEDRAAFERASGQENLSPCAWPYRHLAAEHAKSPPVSLVALKFRQIAAIACAADVIRRHFKPLAGVPYVCECASEGITGVRDGSRGFLRGLFLSIKIVIAIFWVVDELARPLYRPLLDWIASWRVLERFTSRVKALPRSVILVLFAIPFAVAEPLKVLALVVIAKGSALAGIALLIFAYLMTFLIVERIYHAGRDKLLTYPWLKWAMTQIGAIRSSVISARRSMLTWVRTRKDRGG